MNHNATSLLRIIILLLSVLSTSALTARSDKEFKKLIQALDVPDTVKRLNSNDPALFWNTLAEQDITLYHYKKSKAKKKIPVKKIDEQLAQYPFFYPQYDPTVIDEYSSLLDSIKNSFGFNDAEIYIIQGDYPNAYAVLTEDSFAVCITEKILSLKGMSTEILVGIIAHEYTHGLLLHHERSIYEDIVAKSKHSAIAVLATAVAVTSGAVQSYYNGKFGYDDSQNTQNTANTIREIDYWKKINDIRSHFKYSKKQEYQSDLVAFRYLQHLGCGSSYIEVLRCLSANTGSGDPNLIDDEYNDHPTFQDRIAFLKYAEKHPEIGSKFKGHSSIAQLDAKLMYSDPIYD